MLGNARFVRAVLALAGLLVAAAPAAAAPLRVAVSVAPQAWIVDRIGGDRVETLTMVPLGTEAERYEITPRQAVVLESVAAYVRVAHPNFPFEERFILPWLRDHPRVRDIPTAAGMDLLTDARGGDPHLWVAPASIRVAARHVAAALVSLDPAGAATLATNLQAVLAEIDAVDRDLQATLAGIDRNCPLIVYHPAWAYLARDYGLKLLVIEASGHDPAPQQMAALIAAARACPGNRTVFVQRGFSSAAALAVAHELGGEVREVEPLVYDWPANIRRIAAAFRDALAHAR